MNEPVEILLVEDNPDDIELTMRALHKHNLANRVRIAGDGGEALEYLFADGRGDVAPRLVILDLKLPKVSGLEVLQSIKADERTRAIPVVVLTSSQEERDLVESYHLGTNSRTIRVADVLEAMSSHRPYRPARGIEETTAEIEAGCGTRYDPVAAEACLCLLKEGRVELGGWVGSTPPPA